jgi:hypothetical protein
MKFRAYEKNPKYPGTKVKQTKIKVPMCIFMHIFCQCFDFCSFNFIFDNNFKTSNVKWHSTLRWFTTPREKKIICNSNKMKKKIQSNKKGIVKNQIEKK